MSILSWYKKEKKLRTQLCLINKPELCSTVLPVLISMVSVVRAVNLVSVVNVVSIVSVVNDIYQFVWGLVIQRDKSTLCSGVVLLLLLFVSLSIISWNRQLKFLIHCWFIQMYSDSVSGSRVLTIFMENVCSVFGLMLKPLRSRNEASSYIKSLGVFELLTPWVCCPYSPLYSFTNSLLCTLAEGKKNA